MPVSDTIVVAFLGALGGVIVATITTRRTKRQDREQEANTESVEVKTMSTVIETLRAENQNLRAESANQLKRKIEYRDKWYEEKRNSERLAAYAFQLRRQLKKIAPDLEVYEMDENGHTTPHNITRASE